MAHDQQTTLTSDTLRAAVARAIEALLYVDESTGEWALYKRIGPDEVANAALRAIVQAAGLDAGDLTNAAWAVGQFRRTSATVAFLRALASAAEPPS